jgi:acetyl esterase
MDEANVGNSISFDPSVFKPEAISPETLAANEAFWQATVDGPDWWKVGAPAYRSAAAGGKGPFPRPEKSERARTIHVQGKGGHEIALRIIAPEQAKGVYLFMHGGGRYSVRPIPRTRDFLSQK